MRLAFTICSNNFLSYALTFANSLLVRNPSYKIVIGLADKRTDDIDYAGFGPHEVISMDEVGISNLAWMTENYNIVELNTAVKPFYFEYLFKRFSPSHIFFFDPDVFVFDSLDALANYFDDHDVLLTPHVINPIPKAVYPWENHFLKHGVYNLGFIGLRNSNNTQVLLKWWQERLETHCFADAVNGLYVDQLWANYIPAFFQNVLISKNPGLNVAFWNLHERRISESGGQILVNGEPLIFFHFSSFDPRVAGALYKTGFSNFEYNDNHTLKSLVLMYADSLRMNHYDVFSSVQYAYLRSEKSKTDLNQLIAKIGYKEKVLQYLLLRFIKSDRIIEFVFSLLSDYVEYINLTIKNRNDYRHNNFRFIFDNRKKILSNTSAISPLTKIRAFASSLISFLR